MLASAPVTHKPARTTWSFLLTFLPPSSLIPSVTVYFFYFFQGSGSRLAPHPTAEPAPADSRRIRFGYCSTVVPFFLYTDN